VCPCVKQVIVSGQRGPMKSCLRHGGVGRGLTSRRHRGVQQEDHLFRQPEDHVRLAIQLPQSHSYLLACARPASLDAVAALDDIRLERNGSWSAVQLQKETAGVAEDGAGFITAP
jgi:hypothetical protein